ncbi:hypothetical protein D1872_267870 [compost metagenome]
MLRITKNSTTPATNRDTAKTISEVQKIGIDASVNSLVSNTPTILNRVNSFVV